MSEALVDFELEKVNSLKDAIKVLSNSPNSRVLAGGTDLIVNMRRGLVEAKTLVDIEAIPELHEFSTDADGVHIGAGVTLSQICENADIAAQFQSVSEAAKSVAAATHRETATLGGNICLDTRCLYYNQSHWWRKSNDYCLKYKGTVCHVAPKGNVCRAAFSGDMAPALMVHGAEVEIIGPKGRRRVLLSEFYREDGANFLRLEPAELLVAIHIPSSRLISSYHKVRIRGAIDFPLAGVAVACERLNHSSHRFVIAVTGTNPCPLLIEDIGILNASDDSQVFFDHLGKRVQKTVTPQRTTTTAAHYRRLSIAAIAIKRARELWAKCD